MTKISEFLPKKNINTKSSFNVKYVNNTNLPKIYASRKDTINTLLAQLISTNQRLILLHGIDGSGKTTIARKLVESLGFENSYFSSALWYSFYRDDDIEHFLVEACRLLIDNFDVIKYPSPFSKVLILKEELGRNNCLIILDGFELMQDQDLSSQTYGTIKYKALKDLLLGLCEEQIAAKVLITSRVRLTEFQDVKRYSEYPIQPLSTKIATQYLVDVGITGSEKDISHVCDEFGNHPLTLRILADYLLQMPFNGQIEFANKFLDFTKETSQGDKLRTIFENYWNTLNLSEKYFLSRIALLKSGARKEMLELLAADNSGKPCTATHSDFRATLRRLRHSSLLSIDSAGKNLNITIHHLIQQNVKNKIDEDSKMKFHLDFANYYKKISESSKEFYILRDLQPILDRYYHLIGAYEYDMAYELMLDASLKLLTRLLLWGHYWLAYELFLSPLIVAYETKFWEPTRQKMSYIYRQAGNIMAKTKGTLDAEIFYNKAILVVDGNNDLAARPVQCLSELLAEAGRFQDAYIVLHRLMTIDQNRHYKLDQHKLVGQEGYINAGLGNISLARKRLTNAIALSSNPAYGDDGYLCLLLRIRGDLNVNCESLDLAQEDYKAALKIAKKRENNYTDYVGHILRGFGDIFRLQGRTEKSENMYRKALFIAQNTGSIWLEAEARIGLSLIKFELGDYESAHMFADDVSKILPSKNWLVPETQAFIILSNISIALGNVVEAKNYFEKAVELCSLSYDYWTKRQTYELQEEIMEGR